jgi:gluconate kinase
MNLQNELIAYASLELKIPFREAERLYHEDNVEIFENMYGEILTDDDRNKFLAQLRNEVELTDEQIVEWQENTGVHPSLRKSIEELEAFDNKDISDPDYFDKSEYDWLAD